MDFVIPAQRTATDDRLVDFVIPAQRTATDDRLVDFVIPAQRESSVVLSGFPLARE
jgi:hypothetical protein